MQDPYSVGQPVPQEQGADDSLTAQHRLQAAQPVGQGGSTGAGPIVAPAAATAPARARSREELDRLGLFWGGPPPQTSYVAPEASVVISQTFINAIERQAEQVKASLFKIGEPISSDEWYSARHSQPAVVENWFYEDVGVFIAPGGTGKTTLLLFQIVHIVLGRPLFGYEVMNAGPVILVTAEDSRETLVARLRLMCLQLQLTDRETREVRENVIITDVSGKGFKLTTVEKDVVVPNALLDRFIVNASEVHPSLIVFDPMVSFGVGESRINDAEQGMIDAARRIRNELRCAVLYVHHTGKANARDNALDQYAGRGGSALADGARMVHVLQRLAPEAWTEATGDELSGDDSGFVLARPKMTWCSSQPHIYLKRRHYGFERFDAIDQTEGTSAVQRGAADKLHQFLKDELAKGTKHTGRTLEATKLLPQKVTRNALQRLVTDGRVISENQGTTGRGGARTYLRPVDLPMTT